MNKRKILSIVRRVRRIDILDGKKRFERVSRRLLILLMGISILVLVLFLTRKEEVVCPNEVNEQIEEDITIPEKTSEIIIEEVKQDKVKEYIESYGGRINDEYLATLRNYCDEETLKLVIAISVAETNMGNSTLRHSNFYGYFYGGNRNYDPDYTEMSEVICRGISKYYFDVASNRAKAVRYTGGDNVDMWIANVNKALSNM